MINHEWGSEIKKLKEDNNKKQDSGGSSSSEVKSSDNRIYFWAPVDTKSVLTFNEELRKVSNNLKRQAMHLGTKPAPIYIHINSPGGRIFDGFSAMDAILRCDVPTISVVDGRAASAATFLSMVADKRTITPHSYMLIHQLSSGMWGKYEDFKDNMSNLDELMRVITNLYIERTALPKKKLKGILKHDLYFNAQKCLKYGLVDEVAQ